MPEASDAHHPIGRIVFGCIRNQTGNFIGADIKRGDGTPPH
jgi:hypothetical protein